MDRARLEVYVRAGDAEAIARAIIDAARTGSAGDGIVAVVPVEAAYRVRTGRLADADEV